MATITKGSITNRTTKAKLTFQNNPTVLQQGRTVKFNDLQTPIGNYPVVQYSGGQSTSFTLEVFVADLHTTTYINTAKSFFDRAMPAISRSVFTPPILLVSFGFFVRNCYLEDYQMNVTEFHTSLRPKHATFTLKLKVV